MKLVLFDIDGTLLRSGGAGRRSMEDALRTLFGTTGDPAYRYDGKTDRQIAREQLRAVGIDDAIISARMDELLEAYVQRLTEELARDASAVTLCAGVPALLDALEQQPDVTVGLLTGNIERGAREKLRAVDMLFDRFKVNAFGSDHEHRTELPAVAQRRARDMFGVELVGHDLVIIGDTPMDIHCGRALGVRAIGVATGWYSVDDLHTHAPYAAFESLTDTDAVLSAMLD